MDQIRPKTGNPLAILFLFLYVLLILCVPNVSKHSYHDTGSDQLSAQHKGVLVIVVWEHAVSDH